VTEAVAAPWAPPGPAAPRDRLGAIDVGSNSIRLLVAEYDPQTGLSVIDEVKDQPRLAQGLAATGRLDATAIERAMQALARMREVCHRRGVSRLVAVATAAVREAANGPDFAARVQRELGIPLQVIDAETEAQLAWRSVQHHFRLAGERTLVADIGGGSLELIGAVNGLIELIRSLPFGAVRLTEMFMTNRRDPWRDIAELRRHARKTLRKTFARHEWAAAHVIGSGGSFTSLGRMAALRRGLPAADSVHGTVVTTAEVEQLLEWLATRTTEQRRAVPGLNPERADIILAGLAVTAELLDAIGARQLTVSAFGLREGLLLDMVGAAPEAPVADRLRLIRDFVDRCQCDRRHVEQVRVLALQLHDQLGGILGATPEERDILEAAGLLHDVGQLVSYRRHHHHSYQLIMHAERLGLDQRQRALVAIVSRYHRKRGPSRKHEEFARLSLDDQAIVRRMSALLRVADGLDRGHTASVERVQCELGDDVLVLRALPRLARADLSLEAWGASRKADVLAKLLDREVQVVVQP